jgi:hypothetical protein
VAELKAFNSKYFWMVAQDCFQIVTACSFRNVEDDFVWAFTPYGPNLDNVRSLLREEFAGLISWWDLSWCTGGDFNVTHFPNERTGAACLSPTMTIFGLHLRAGSYGSYPRGGTFTWSNTSYWSRIDHFLVSPEWKIRYPSLLQKKMLRLCSNHFPILLDSGCFLGRKRPFKFENMCLKADGFVDRVWSWWSSYHLHGTPSYVLAQKLKALKVDINRWNEYEFGNMSSLCKERVEEPKAMDRLEEGKDRRREGKENGDY